ncbi:MAG: hypothetical protein HZB38_06420 [Planctomycetes bacterium]|nr:hypothetical protein [Planctomycetota bacterium]
MKTLTHLTQNFFLIVPEDALQLIEETLNALAAAALAAHLLPQLAHLGFVAGLFGFANLSREIRGVFLRATRLLGRGAVLCHELVELDLLLFVKLQTLRQLLKHCREPTLLPGPLCTVPARLAVGRFLSPGRGGNRAKQRNGDHP